MPPHGRRPRNEPPTIQFGDAKGTTVKASTAFCTACRSESLVNETFAIMLSIKPDGTHQMWAMCANCQQMYIVAEYGGK